MADLILIIGVGAEVEEEKSDIRLTVKGRGPQWGPTILVARDEPTQTCTSKIVRQYVSTSMSGRAMGCPEGDEERGAHVRGVDCWRGEGEVEGGGG